MSVLALALVLAGLAGIAWLAVRLYRLRQAPPLETPSEHRPSHATYSDEIVATVARLSRLERDTLLHIRRQGLQTFTADRDSPVLTHLVALHLLSARGSSALPADDYPFVVPREVWRHLGELIGAPDASTVETSSPRRR